MGGRTSTALNDNAAYTGQKKGGVFYVNVPAYSMHYSAFFQLMAYCLLRRKTGPTDANWNVFAAEGKASIFGPLGHQRTSFHKDIYRLYTEKQSRKKCACMPLISDQYSGIILINK
jgi:hypothetical protein